MRFSRAGRLCSAAIVAACLALAPAGALAYNPGNHGHHYGQLKHQQTPPPPSIVPPVVGPAPAVGGAIATTMGQISAAVPPVAELPLPEAAPVISVAADRPNGDGVSWLVLLILPGLVAVWLIVFARGAITMSRRMRRTPVPA